MIRSVRGDDAKDICVIYNHYVKETVITFEEMPVAIKEMAARIGTISAKYPWLVWEDEILGVTAYAYANTWRDRYAYRYAAELSLYVKNGLEGKGLGSRLMTALIETMRKKGFHTLVSGITLPNERSTALHEKFGFTKTAQFNEIGFKQDRWLDVGYWELVL
ncbi:MAG: GNAT family N-acetyltransferase [Treponema sp.]|jgi:phosphinothricin acetyltransferase|nr:GNAT family N-acetyltransferase [Treponema sp.]